MARKPSIVLKSLISALLTVGLASGAQVSIPDTQADPNTTVAIAVQASGAVGIAGFQFTITFDASVLSLDSVTAGTLTDGWMVTPNIASGQVRVAGVDGTLSGISENSGSLLKLSFKVTGSAGKSCTIAFTEAKLRDSQAGNIECKTDTGDFAVSTPSDPALKVSPDRYDNVSWEGKTVELTVENTGTGTMGWTSQVTTGGDWLTITSRLSGTNSGKIAVKAGKNETGKERTGKVKVEAPGASGSPKVVEIQQAKEPPDPNENDPNDPNDPDDLDDGFDTICSSFGLGIVVTILTFFVALAPMRAKSQP